MSVTSSVMAISRIILVLIFIKTSTCLLEGEQFLQTNSLLVNLLKNEYKQRISKIAHLKLILSRLVEAKSKVTDEEFLKRNPLTVSLLVKRLVIDIEPIKTMLGNVWWQAQRLKLPTYLDLEKSIQQISKVRETYLHKIDPFNYSPPLCLTITPDDLFEFGRQSYIANDFHYAIGWLEASLQMLRHPNNGDQKEKIDFFEYLAMSYYALGDIKTAIEVIDHLLFIHPTHIRSILNRLHFEHQIHRSEPIVKKVRFDSDLYHDFCRKKVSHLQRFPKCYFHTHGNKLAPFKSEEISLDTKMVLFHDILTDKEIDILYDIAKPKHIEFRQNFALEKNEMTETALLYPGENVTISKVYKRMEYATGLDMHSSDTLHLSKYKLKDFYLPHFDVHARQQSPEFLHQEKGQRLATVLIYLSEGFEGGSTTFPVLDLQIKPTKGSALFWFNLHHDGTPRLDSLHAGTPVFKGTKIGK